MIRPWQATLLAVALTTLTATVVTPVVVLLWFGGTIALTAIAVEPFASLVREDRFALGGAVYLAAFGTVVPAVVDLARRTRRGILSMRGAALPREPWWSGSWPRVAACTYALVFFALTTGFNGSTSPVRTVLAGALLAAVLTGTLTLLGALIAAAVFALRALWRLGLRSPMVTGTILASAVLLPTMGYLNLALLDAVAQAQVVPMRETARSVCESPGLHELCGLRGARQNTVSTLQRGPDAEAPSSEGDHPLVASCMELLHAPDPVRGCSYTDMVDRATRVLRNRDDALDVVQQTLLAVCLRHEQQAIQDLPAYFARSVMNRAHSDRRRRWCTVDVDEEMPVPCPMPTPEETVIHEERVRAVEFAFCNLELNDASIIQLRDFEDVEYAELARRFGTTEMAVRQRHSRARRTLIDYARRRCE